EVIPKPAFEETAEPRPQYFASLNYFFEHPDWGLSLLLGSVCLLIPVINTMILLGYRYEVVEMQLRFPDQFYPKFDVGRFSQYLSRGLIPFLLDFLMQFIINFPLQISVWLCIGLVAAAGNAQSQLMVVVAGVGVPLVILIDITLLIALNLVLVPIMIRAGLSQDFNLTFKFAWIKDFLQRVGVQALLFNLFLMSVGAVLIIPGYLACCVGMLAVGFYLMGPVLAHHHLQLYRLYLARGGEPIPLRPLQMAPAFAQPAVNNSVPTSPFAPPQK